MTCSSFRNEKNDNMPSKTILTNSKQVDSTDFCINLSTFSFSYFHGCFTMYISLIVMDTFPSPLSLMPLLLRSNNQINFFRVGLLCQLKTLGNIYCFKIIFINIPKFYIFLIETHCILSNFILIYSNDLNNSFI